MPIPDYQSIMLPLLMFASNEQENHLGETVEHLANYFNLSEEEKEELLPSGGQYVFVNRVSWARTYLTKAGLLEKTRRGYFRITNLGLNVLKEKPNKIDIDFLKKFPNFVEFKQSTKLRKDPEIKKEKTPLELLEDSYRELKEALSQELLDFVKKMSPRAFEKLVVDLLVKIGYGSSLQNPGQVLGTSKDGGVDGIIKEDKLGLDSIFIQAKRWNNAVGSKNVRDFVGSLAGKGANKGVFITTSNFTKDALDYVQNLTEKKIALIDGKTLAQLMIEYNVGVAKTASYEIKKIDFSYFEEE